MSANSPASMRLFAAIASTVVLALACSNTTADDDPVASANQSSTTGTTTDNAPGSTTEVAGTTQPDIILINLDDADIDLLDQWALEAWFPNIAAHVARGTRYDNLHVVAPICGPSRGSLFRGQYPHNSGIEQNDGGWNVFYDRGYTDSEIGMWMREAGYHTALVGKYCHTGYPKAAEDSKYHPPGWDDFHASLGSPYFDVTRVINGERARTAPYPDEYRTDMESISVQSILDTHHRGDGDKPLFLYIAPFAPHETSHEAGMVEPDYAEFASTVTLPRTEDFDEVDVSDKTPQYAALRRLDPAMIQLSDDRYRRRIQSLKSVDDMVGEITEALESAGTLDTTYVFLTSDNGFQLGHHRDFAKQDHFDRVTRVQLLVSGPGVPAGETHSHLLAHIDLVPTFVELAGGQQHHWFDGRSFAELLPDPNGHPERAWQERILVENTGPKTPWDQKIDATYQMLRRFDSSYVEWENGDRAYYDLVADPLQLDNAYRSLDDETKAELAAALAELRDCAGAACQGGDGIDPVTVVLNEPGTGTAGKTTISGTATDDDAVAYVEVVVRRVADRAYWNGTSFEATYAAVAVAVAEQAAVDWALDVPVEAGARYWTSARAVDLNNNETPIAATRFFDG